MPTVLITGANRGIGLSLARALHAKGWKVIATVRQPTAAGELKAVADAIVALDVADEASIAQLPAHVTEPIDLLINNAGIYHKQDVSDLGSQPMLEEFKVNAVAPILIARALLPRLQAAQKGNGPSGRVINMTSRMGSIADNSSGGSYGYRASKAALNAMTKSWSIDVPATPVLLVHPGFIQTDMTSGRGEMGPDSCAALLLTNIIEPFMAGEKWTSGQFLHRDGSVLPW